MIDMNSMLCLVGVLCFRSGVDILSRCCFLCSGCLCPGMLCFRQCVFCSLWDIFCIGPVVDEDVSACMFFCDQVYISWFVVFVCDAWYVFE